MSNNSSLNGGWPTILKIYHINIKYVNNFYVNICYNIFLFDINYYFLEFNINILNI